MSILLATALLACNPSGPREYATYELTAQLDDPEHAASAVDELATRGELSLPDLERFLKNREADVGARGQAVLAVVQIGIAADDPAEADRILAEIQEDEEQTELLRIWAVSGRLQFTQDTDAFLELAKNVAQWPALERPVELRLATMDLSARQALELSSRIPALQGALTEILLGADPGELVAVMIGGEDDGIRRQAAAWLATQAQKQGTGPVAEATIAALTFQSDAEQVPWLGGALFIPSISWDQENARALIGNLIGWHLYAVRTEDSGSINQLGNNLQSIGLNASGMSLWNARDTRTLLQEWRRVSGAASTRELIEASGVDESIYGSMLR